MAGSIAVATSRVAGLTKYSVAWTADSAGNVSANTFDIVYGYVVQAYFIPGVSQPSDSYRVSLLDTNSVDLLGGVGINLSGSYPSLLIPSQPLWTDGTTVTLSVDSAGAAVTGTATIWIGPYPPQMQTIDELRGIRSLLSQGLGIYDATLMSPRAGGQPGSGVSIYVNPIVFDRGGATKDRSSSTITIRT